MALAVAVHGASSLLASSHRTRDRLVPGGMVLLGRGGGQIMRFAREECTLQKSTIVGTSCVRPSKSTAEECNSFEAVKMSSQNVSVNKKRSAMWRGGLEI